MTQNKHLVLHCDSASRPACHVAGVYTFFDEGKGAFYNSYGYDPEMTYKMSIMGWADLEDRGYCFDFPIQHSQPLLVQAADFSTFILCLETGERLKEINIPRSRDSSYWNDSNSLLCMNPLDIYSRWESNRGDVLKIAITPLETLIQARAATKIDVLVPLKYTQAPDFSALATVAAVVENEEDSSAKAVSRKKRSKKKGKRCAASNANKSTSQALSDSSLEAHTSRPGRLLERQSIVMHAATSETKPDNHEGNDPSKLNNNNKNHKKKKKDRCGNDESRRKCEQAHQSDDEVSKIDEIAQVTSDIVGPQGS